MNEGASAPSLRTDAKSLWGYRGAAGSYDEALDGEGRVRPAWKKFVAAADAMTRVDFARRWEQAQRLVQQNSLAFPDPRDPAARLHPWELDAFPLLIEPDEWRAVATGLQQRAALLDLILQDLYGPQNLVRRGLVPAEALYRHPGFLLPYCRGEAPAQRMLHFYAADLVRMPDGAWRVLGDRTESPSGSGFALQNRIALSRILPDVYRECAVERHAPYFLAVQEQLARCAHRTDRSPRIVYLSQLAGSINYSEDAFLARYLGYTLAEAGDLAVRHNEVYIKTLAGLSQVDVLLRRPNSEHCDPLELSDLSSIGVAGLLQSVRSGNVTVANALGSGLAESPMFLAFLPKLANELMGAPLALPEVTTWWCGDEASRKYVVEHLDQLSIKPAHRRRGRRDSLARQISNMRREDLAALIAADPAAYVAQEHVVRSSAPVWSEGHVRSSYIALRAFVVASGDGYVVMPGGLARVSDSLAPLELSLLDGERSKDVWALASGPVPTVTLLGPADRPLEIRRGGVDLPSRAAENFFWMGRQAVRAEALAKLVRAVALRLTSEQDAGRLLELPLLIRVLAELGQIEAGYVVDDLRVRMPAVEHALPLAAFDAQAGSLRTAVSQLAYLAATVRDLLSLDSWRIIRLMDEGFRPAPNAEPLLDLSDKLESLLIHLAALTGQVAEGMTRTNAWRFLDFGRRLERALQTIQLIGAVLTSGGAVDAAALEALLEILDSNMTYRSRYFSQFQLGAVLDLLVFDRTNPRSVAYQISKCANHAASLPRPSADTGPSPEQILSDALLKLFRRSDCLELAREFEAGNEEPLHGLLAAAAASLPKLSESLANRYFYHSGPVRRL